MLAAVLVDQFSRVCEGPNWKKYGEQLSVRVREIRPNQLLCLMKSKSDLVELCWQYQLGTRISINYKVNLVMQLLEIHILYFPLSSGEKNTVELISILAFANGNLWRILADGPRI